MVSRAIRVVTESFVDRPALDIAVSRAILHAVGEGNGLETLRIYWPGDVVTFGVQDRREPGYGRAIGAARSRGFEVAQRLVGGRAAVFHKSTIAFGWAIPDSDPRSTIEARFKDVATLMTGAFRGLRVDAHIGEVRGEYCPGRFSVNARGSKKIMGIGQRVILRAAYVGGVVVVGGSDRIRDVLDPVYEAMNLAWDPDTVGSIEDELGHLNYEDVKQAILNECSARFDLTEDSLSSDTLALAKTYEAEDTVL